MQDSKVDILAINDIKLCIAKRHVLTTDTLDRLYIPEVHIISMSSVSLRLLNLDLH